MRRPLGPAILLLMAVLLPAPAAAQDQKLVNQLIERIVAGEQQFVARLKRMRPILETYIQELAEGSDPDSPPVNDHYMIGRLDLSEDADPISFATSPAFQKRGRRLPLPFRKGSPALLSPAGFAQMVVIDADSFNRETYSFEFVRREFLGDLRCLVFDVVPKDKKTLGRFIGRVWVEDRESRIVRFNGTYTGSKSSSVFLHFDSWRLNVAPGVWAPAAVYIEDERVLPGKPVRFKGQTRLWGYKPLHFSRLQELTSILIEAKTPVKDQSGSRDASPVESQRSWNRQAEENVTYRLEKAGLLAPKGEVDQVLNTVVNNLMVTNNIILDEVQCRVLLTTPLETFSVGRTIVISRGLLDVLPDEATLAVILSDELAHIVLGHRTETMYGFGDETMFSDKDILTRFQFSRTPPEMEAAGKKAMELLAKSPYKDKLSNAGLFLKVLASRAPRLPNLIQANLGNRLATANQLTRLAVLAQQAPPVDENKLEQVAALPLGSRIKLDPWTNRISLIKTRPVALFSVREKMPFQVTPFSIHLTRFEAQVGMEQSASLPGEH